VPDQPPRRRSVDNERRRWNDQAFDLLADDVEELKLDHRALSRLPAEMAALRREFEEWKLERREDITEFRTDIRELQQENRVAHGRLARGRDPLDGGELPALPTKLTWGDVVKIATAVGLVIAPIAAIVAALLGSA
jgi:hypothetical protein